MKILFVSSSSEFFVNHHLRLAASCADLGEVHVAVAPADAEHRRRIEEHGLAVHPVVLSRSSVNPFSLASEILSLKKLFARVEPDVIVPVTIKVLFVAALANLLWRKVPLLGMVTGLGYLFTGEGKGRAALRAAVTRTLAVSLARTPSLAIFSNPDDQREFIAAGVTDWSRSRVIPVPGVDTAAYRRVPEPASGFRVVLPARMLWEKGVGEFVEAARLVRAEAPEAEFLLAGGVDAHNPAAIGEDLLREWTSRGDVVWLGRIAAMPELLASCHVVCLPSYREGFPMALSEAMACGIPIVTTDVPGCREAVLGHDSGLLVPPRDPIALAEALIHFHRFPNERRVKGDNGRRFAEERLDRVKVEAAFKGALKNLLETS